MRRQPSMVNIWTRKSTAELLDEAALGDGDDGEVRALKRTLSALNLMALGVGGIIGAGIFVLTGHAAAANAGPAVALSFLLGAVACAFAGLCYAEMSSAVPISGSAYTYAYATLGELAAWIIGWDLILEYAVGSATVAHGWSHYFQDFIGILGFKIPHVLSTAPFDYDPKLGHFVSTGTVLDLPAIIITIIVTVILVKGIRESASFNATMVIVKLIIVFFVIIVGAFYVNPANWKPFAPFGLTGLSFFGHTVMGRTGPCLL